MHIRIALVLVVSAICCNYGNAVAAESHRQAADACFAGVPLALDGLLTAHREYGPPGWGEDPAMDSRWTMIELEVSPAQAGELRRSLPGCFEPTDDLGRDQLWPHGIDLSRYRGERVHVAGRLAAAGGAPAEITPAQMKVTSITLAPPGAGNRR